MCIRTYTVIYYIHDIHVCVYVRTYVAMYVACACIYLLNKELCRYYVATVAKAHFMLKLKIILNSSLAM